MPRNRALLHPTSEGQVWLLGFRLSLKPADEDHPYGHGKIDALAGMFSGLCLFAAAIVIGYYSIVEIRTPHHLPAWFTLPVLVLPWC